MIYADFESIVEPEKNCTKNFEKQVACSCLDQKIY